MDDLIGLTQWLKEEKGIIKIDLLELVSYAPEYELWKQRN